MSMVRSLAMTMQHCWSWLPHGYLKPMQGWDRRSKRNREWVYKVRPLYFLLFYVMFLTLCLQAAQQTQWLCSFHRHDNGVSSSSYVLLTQTWWEGDFPLSTVLPSPQTPQEEGFPLRLPTWMATTATAVQLPPGRQDTTVLTPQMPW